MDRHIVIAGQGRAGTTLFYNMLRSTLKGFEMPDSEVQAKHYIDEPGNYCTKRPFDIFDIPNILKAAHGKKIVDLIVTMRDPRDVLLSKHKRVPDDYFVGADHCWFVPKGMKPTFTAPGILPTHAAITTIINSGIFPSGVFVLKYEDLVDNPEGVKEALANAYGLEFEGNFSDFHKQEIPDDLSRALNGIRPVEKAKEPKWKKPEHRDRIIDQFTRFPDLHKVLINFGYEEDTKWFEDLIMMDDA
jgi:hypothetical protein